MELNLSDWLLRREWLKDPWRYRLVACSALPVRRVPEGGEGLVENVSLADRWDVERRVHKTFLRQTLIEPEPLNSSCNSRGVGDDNEAILASPTRCRVVAGATTSSAVITASSTITETNRCYSAATATTGTVGSIEIGAVATRSRPCWAKGISSRTA